MAQLAVWPEVAMLDFDDDRPAGVDRPPGFPARRLRSGPIPPNRTPPARLGRAGRDAASALRARSRAARNVRSWCISPFATHPICLSCKTSCDASRRSPPARSRTRLERPPAHRPRPHARSAVAARSVAGSSGAYCGVRREGSVASIPFRYIKSKTIRSASGALPLASAACRAKKS